MSRLPRLGILGALGVLGLVLVAACRRPGRVERVGPSPAAPVPSAAGWIVAAEDDTLRVSVDTAGWDQSRMRGVYWIAISDVSTPERRASTSPFLRFETRQEVDCAHQRARSLDIRTLDRSGRRLRVYPVRDSTWQPFARARLLDGAVLLAVCSKLAELRRS